MRSLQNWKVTRVWGFWRGETVLAQRNLKLKSGQSALKESFRPKGNGDAEK